LISLFATMQSALRRVFRSQPVGRSLRCQTIVTAGFPRPSSAHLRYAHTTRYTSDHELIKVDQTTGIGTISITNHAQSALGDVVFVELPNVGSEVKQGDAIGAVESVKAASEVYAPISGTVEEINGTLADQPGLLNKSPEDEGWLCRIKLSNPTEMDELMTFEEYTASITD